MRLLLASFAGAAIAVAAPSVALAQGCAPAASAAAKFSTGGTDIGTLMDNKDAWAVVTRHLPEFASNDQIAMARGLTLKAVQSFAADVITDAKLAAIDADLAKLK